MQLQPTFFAPAERATAHDLFNDYQSILSNGHIASILDAMPLITAMLNLHRQIVFSNKALLKFIGIENLKKIIGLRPGEMLECLNARNNTGGCGTSEACELCGASAAIIQSQLAKKVIKKECRISAWKNNMPVSYDLLVTATPVQINQNQFTLLSIEDISHAKRRRAIEKIFFHDVINTAGGIKGYIEYLQLMNHSEDTAEHLERLNLISDELIEEILSQRDLTAAETGELIIETNNLSTIKCLMRIKQFIEYHPVAKGKSVVIAEDSVQTDIVTDPVLLKRVLLNMVKNALEASDEGANVIAGAKKNQEKIIFYVHNQQFIPRPIQLQLFQRSFSTKSASRGLGTYSMKLITEKYLKGRVWFETSTKDGTTFYVELPEKL